MAWAWAVGSPARGKVCPNYNLWLVSDIGGGCGQGDTGTSAAMETPSDQHQCFSWSSNIVKSPSCSKWAGDELEVVGTEREKSIPGQQPNKILKKTYSIIYFELLSNLYFHKFSLVRQELSLMWVISSKCDSEEMYFQDSIIWACNLVIRQIGII